MKKPSFALLPFLLFVTPLCKGDTIYAFALNTTSLVGNGPFTVDLQLLDGSGTPGDLNNNKVQLSPFSFGVGGSPSGKGMATGGASGNLTSGVTLADTVFLNEYLESFTPGTLLSFTIDTTNVPDSGGTPDLFTLAILDGSGNELPTTGPAEEFLDVSLTGGTTPQVASFSSAPGSTFAVPAPELLIKPGIAPEPSFTWEVLAALVGLTFVLTRWRTR